MKFSRIVLNWLNPDYNFASGVFVFQHVDFSCLTVEA